MNESLINKHTLKTRQEMLGSYLMSLPKTLQLVSGKRVKAICQFLESKHEVSSIGWKEYLKENRAFLSEPERIAVTDFLYFHGIKLGRVRKENTRIVKRLDKVSEANKRKISDFIEWVEKQYEYSPASIKLKSGNMKKYFQYFVDFNNDNCRSFIKTMEAEGMHPKTLNVYMLTLKQYGDFLKKPIALKKISIQQSLSVENVPTAREYKSFIEWLRNNEKWQMYWIVKVLGMTGMRLSELMQVKWSDILSGDFYPRCKGKKHRMIYFPKQLISEAKEWVKTSGVDPEQLLIVSKKTKMPLSSRGISETMKNVAFKAGFPLEKAHCHAFRHFFAKQYLAKTKDVIQLAELLGHESVDTTRLYLQKSKEEQKRDINKNIDW